MAVRAKFRVNGVDLRQQAVYNPTVRAAGGDPSTWSAFTEKAKEMGLPVHITVTMPTVRLNPVYPGPDASDEDKAFWTATPNGELSMVIDNPDAAEFFELGEDYFLTFERAYTGS